MADTNSTLIVTRHHGLVDWLNRNGICGTVIEQATADDVQGKDVIGVLPLHLAALCKTVTAVDYNCPRELRGVDLTAEQLDQFGAKVSVYKVEKLN